MIAINSILGGLVVAALIFLVSGSLLAISSHPHWFIRGWDFPRVQILVLGWILASAYLVVDYIRPLPWTWLIWVVFALVMLLTAWHVPQIYPYTLLASTQVKSTSPEQRSAGREGRSLRLIISNVEEENDQHGLWMSVIQAQQPDVLIVLEVDERWVKATEQLLETYPFQVIQPQSNWYGMMMLSRLPIVSHELKFMVQEDIPSIDARIKLNNGDTIRVLGVHPRPPEPIRGNDATARDAELAIWGRELSEDSGPVVIGGDLNDVAWSSTTRHFLRTSELLDPRRGRGFFNTFHAHHAYMRFPVDHVFVSSHFTVDGIQRLGFVGSDHFPIQIDLCYHRVEQPENEVLEEEADDDEVTEEMIERAVDDQSMQGDAIEGERKQPMSR